MKFELTTVDRILSKLNRDIRDLDADENDIIEYIGEAMGFLKMPEIQEQAVAFLKVSNYEAEIPCNFSTALQLSYYTDYEVCEEAEVPREDKEEECLDIFSENVSNAAIIRSMIPVFKQEDYSYFDVPWGYNYWVESPCFKEDFCPIRLSENVYFNSIVCKEKEIYKPHCGSYEYTIVGRGENRLFRFSFKEGIVALAYNRYSVDPETGYPLIPDDISVISAITYYVKWKIAERLAWDGREGFSSISKDSEAKWNHYIGQAKNKIKMMNTLDDYQNFLEQSHYVIPDHKKYYGNFRNLGRTQTLKYMTNGN